MTLPSCVQSDPLERRQNLRLGQGSYWVRFAVSEPDRLAAYRLRFAVFNLELNEGLESAYYTGYDATSSTRSATISSSNIPAPAR